MDPDRCFLLGSKEEAAAYPDLSSCLLKTQDIKRGGVICICNRHASASGVFHLHALIDRINRNVVVHVVNNRNCSQMIQSVLNLLQD